MTAIPTAPTPGTAPIGVMTMADPDQAASELRTLDRPGSTPVPTRSAVAVASSVRTESAIRVLLVEELEQIASRIREMLSGHRDVQLVETVSEGRAAMERIVAAAPDVVLIDALVQGDVSGLRVARQMREAGMTTPVVFMSVPDRPVTLSADTGIAEVMMLPFEAEKLVATIVRVDDAHRGPVVVPPTGTIAVFSAKGGVGRTTIAHNLAVAMNQLPLGRTVLIDGDQVHGDLRLHLEAPDTAPSLVQLPTGHVTDEDIASLLWQDGAGLDVLLAPPRMEQADLIMLADVRTAHSVLKRMYGVVIVDVPAAMDDMTLAVLDDADVVLDVTTLRRAAVRKMQRCHAVLTAAAFPMDKIITVVNHVDADDDAAAFTAELGWEPDVWLMHDERLASGAVPAGSSIVTAHADAPISRGFADLAALLVARLQGRPGQLAARAA